MFVAQLANKNFQLRGLTTAKEASINDVTQREKGDDLFETLGHVLERGLIYVASLMNGSSQLQQFIVSNGPIHK